MSTNSKYTAIIHHCETPIVTPYDCWCVPDFHDDFVLLRLSTELALKSTYITKFPESDIIIPLDTFEKCQTIWDKFQDWQYSECHLLRMRGKTPLELLLNPPPPQPKSIVSRCELVLL